MDYFLFKNEKAAEYREKQNKEKEQLLNDNEYLKGLYLNDLNHDELEKQNIPKKILEIEKRIQEYAICPDCQFVFKINGLKQHITLCKMKFYNSLITASNINQQQQQQLNNETPEKIYKKYEKKFAQDFKSIENIRPLTYKLLINCLKENSWIKAYFDIKKSRENQNRVNIFQLN
jgi:hypothetical protein